MNRTIVANCTFVLAALFCSCASSLSARAVPDADLRKRTVYYVAQHAADKRGVNTEITEQLKAWGRSATTGPIENVPANTDVVVTYSDKWVWDMSMYLLSLDVSFRDPMTEAEIAGGTSMQTSIGRLNVREHVTAVLTEIFKKTNPEEKPPVIPED